MWPVDPLGFLGTSPFRRENPNLGLLDFLGFPWILSSESSDINGLRWIFSGSFFLRPVSAREAGTGSCCRGIRKGGIVHEASLHQFLIVSN
jgi:hypothetical protein